MKATETVVVARCGPDTDHDWIVERDGVRVARFISYDQNSVYFAARVANKLRRELHG